jgi:translation initiation factor 1A
MEEQVTRVRLPRGEEVIGEVEETLGASRFKIRTKDGREIMCRIPGRFRRRIKIRVGDLVIAKPWVIEPEKGDIAWIYNKTHAAWLRKNGYI